MPPIPPDQLAAPHYPTPPLGLLRGDGAGKMYQSNRHLIHCALRPMSKLACGRVDRTAAAKRCSAYLLLQRGLLPVRAYQPQLQTQNNGPSPVLCTQQDRQLGLAL